MLDDLPPKASPAGQAKDGPASTPAGYAPESSHVAAWGRIRPVWADRLLAVAVAVALLAALVLASLHSYLLFHSLAELFSIVVACSIFLVVWNMRRLVRQSYLLWVGIAYLFVAVLDGVHTLAYKGMGVFDPPGSNLATQLWVAARYLESLSLLIATFFIRRRVRAEVVFLGYGAAAVLILLSIFHWEIFPHCFEEGAGLTRFKVVSEYAICGILAASIVQLVRRRAVFDPGVLGLLIASVGVTIVEEVAFTLYTDPYGPANFIGHCLKILSFYLIYRALVHTALVSPYSVLFRDLKRAQDDLERAVAELERSNADLDQFARVASHDLRAPLALVADYLRLLERSCKDRLGPDDARCIDYAQEGVRRMQALIDDILTYSRLDSRGRAFEPVASSDVVEAALVNLQAAREGAGAEVAFGDLPLVTGDARQLIRLFQNLLDNAIKFRGDRPPRIYVAAERDGGAWRFTVRDNGIGIPPEARERIFAMFERLHGHDDYPGTGIGLALCKRIVERHGGRIWLESEVGRGTTFYFTLPAAEPAS